MPANFAEKLFNPRVILPILGLLLIAVVVLTPQGGDTEEATRLSTFRPSPGGAKGIHEVMRRLGWDAERREQPFAEPLARDAVYAVMAPSAIPMSAQEVGVLLRAVREGASLFYVLGTAGFLSDSLGLSAASSALGMEVDSTGLIRSIPPARACSPSVLGRLMRVAMLDSRFTNDSTLPRGYSEYLSARTVTGDRVQVAIGFEYGAGRVIAIAEPDFLRNDSVRDCLRKEGVLVVRMLEWLGEGRSQKLIFDEYHHGYGAGPSALAVIRSALITSPAGRGVIQVGVAALVLLMCIAVRPIPPVARRVIERRSPLEHVAALARAYEQVGATRRGAELLVRGLRRRHSPAARRGESDEEFLDALVHRYPALAPQVALLKDAAIHPRSPAEFIEVGDAVDIIERKIASEYS